MQLWEVNIVFKTILGKELEKGSGPRFYGWEWWLVRLSRKYNAAFDLSVNFAPNEAIVLQRINFFLLEYFKFQSKE